MTLAIVGVAAGVLVLTRSLTGQWLPEGWLKGLLGAVILRTGVLHATAELRKGREALHGRPFVHLVMGVVEIVLGALVLFVPIGRDQILYNVAMPWSLLGGGLLLFTTVRQFLRERRQEPPEAQSSPASQDQQIGAGAPGDGS